MAPQKRDESKSMFVGSSPSPTLNVASRSLDALVLSLEALWTKRYHVVNRGVPGHRGHPYITASTVRSKVRKAYRELDVWVYVNQIDVKEERNPGATGKSRRFRRVATEGLSKFWVLDLDDVVGCDSIPDLVAIFRGRGVPVSAFIVQTSSNSFHCLYPSKRPALVSGKLAAIEPRESEFHARLPDSMKSPAHWDLEDRFSVAEAFAGIKLSGIDALRRAYEGKVQPGEGTLGYHDRQWLSDFRKKLDAVDSDAVALEQAWRRWFRADIETKLKAAGVDVGFLKRRHPKIRMPGSINVKEGFTCIGWRNPNCLVNPHDPNGFPLEFDDDLADLSEVRQMLGGLDDRVRLGHLEKLDSLERHWLEHRRARTEKEKSSIFAQHVAPLVEWHESIRAELGISLEEKSVCEAAAFVKSPEKSERDTCSRDRRPVEPEGDEEVFTLPPPSRVDCIHLPASWSRTGLSSPSKAKVRDYISDDGTDAFGTRYIGPIMTALSELQFGGRVDREKLAAYLAFGISGLRKGTGRINQMDLADKLGIKQPAVSRLLRALREEGFLAIASGGYLPGKYSMTYRLGPKLKKVVPSWAKAPADHWAKDATFEQMCREIRSCIAAGMSDSETAEFCLGRKRPDDRKRGHADFLALAQRHRAWLLERGLAPGGRGAAASNAKQRHQ